MSAFLDHFHWLRPWWLLALPLLLTLIYLARAQLAGRSPWAQVLDPALLPHLLDQASGPPRRWPVLLAACATGLLVLALAGPAWRQIPQPVFAAPLHRILVVDLSASMDASDLKPSRLQRAKIVAQQLLQQQDEGDTGLAVFAGSAFPVVPLTSDLATVSHLLDSLDTSLPPRQGERIDSGLRMAMNLLQQGDARRGDIVLLTDSTPDEGAREAVREALNMGYRTHVLAVGTAAGAPIPLPQGGWLKDAAGGIQLARLEDGPLQALAQAGGGRYSRIDQIGPDWRLDAQFDRSSAEPSATDTLQADVWQDEGPWLVLPLVLLAALAFRRGWLLGVLLSLPLLQPLPAQAGWWATADQQAHALLQAGDASNAAKTFKTPQWRASALYATGDYAAAAEIWRQGSTAQDAYNLGNALARGGDLPGAAQAYAKALELDPDFEDARANRKLVEDLLKQQQNQPDSSPSEQQDQDQESADSDASQDQGQGQPSSGESQDRESAQQNPASNQDGQPADSEPASEQADAAPEQDPTAAEPAEQANAAEAGQEGDEEAPTQAALEQGLDEQSQATQQWLKRIPDQPGALLREKFRRLQQRRDQGQGNNVR